MNRTEDGAALALALVIVVLASLIAVAVANLVTTGLKFSGTVESDRQASYAADGATDWAINQSAQQTACVPEGTGGTAPLNPDSIVANEVPSVHVVASPVTAPHDGAAYECSYTASANAVNYVTADVEFFAPPATPSTVIRSWTERPPAGG